MFQSSPDLATRRDRDTILCMHRDRVSFNPRLISRPGATQTQPRCGHPERGFNPRLISRPGATRCSSIFSRAKPICFNPRLISRPGATMLLSRAAISVAGFNPRLISRPGATPIASCSERYVDRFQSSPDLATRRDLQPLDPIDGLGLFQSSPDLATRRDRASEGDCRLAINGFNPRLISRPGATPRIICHYACPFGFNPRLISRPGATPRPA